MRATRVERATRADRRLRAALEFEGHVIGGLTVMEASKRAGVTYHEGRSLARAASVAGHRSHFRRRWGERIAESASALLGYYESRLGVVADEIAQAIAKRDALPTDPEFAPAWAKMQREIREMRAEEMLCEERVAAIRASPSPERHDEMAPVELDAPVELEAAPQ